MNNVIRLTKLFFKEGFGTTDNIKDTKKELIKKVMLGIFIFICFIPLIMTMGMAVKNIYDSLVVIGEQSIVIGTLVMSIFAIIFIFGLLSAISILYFASDIENILPLPFKVREIVTAKFITMLLYEYLIVLLISAVIGGTYGVLEGLGAIYWIKLIIVALTLPVIPLALACVLSIVLMRFNLITRNKDRFNLVIGIVAMMIGLGFNIMIQKLMQISPEDLSARLAEGDSLGSIVFNNPLVSAPMNFLVQDDMAIVLKNFALFAVMVVAAFIIYLIVAEALYLKSAMAVNSSSSKRKKLSSEKLSKQSKTRSPIIAYTLKELRMIFRTPAFFMNCVLIELIFPVFFIVPFIAQGTDFSGLGGVLSGIRETVYSSGNEWIGAIAIGTFIFTIFIAGSAIVSGSAITREGGAFYINKMLPISEKHQILGKVLSGIIINTFVLVYVFVINIVLKVPVLSFIVSMLVSFLTIAVINFTQIIPDIMKPKLNWVNEYKAVKQNFAIFVIMIVNFGIAFGVGFLTFMNIDFIIANGVSISLAAIVVLAILMGIMYKVLTTIGVEKYRKIRA